MLREVESQARCLVATAKLGESKPGRDARCLQKRLAALDAARASKDPAKVTVARNMLSTCSDRLVVDKLAPANESPQPELEVEYLQAFQKALLPFGAKIAKCYKRLGKWIDPAALRKGSTSVEVFVDKSGNATHVAVVENDGLDPNVVGCVASTLCRLSAPPPPKPFVLALPFSFEAPK